MIVDSFDELWQLPTDFAAACDFAGGSFGFGFNAGVLFVRPRDRLTDELVQDTNRTDYSVQMVRTRALEARLSSAG